MKNTLVLLAVIIALLATWTLAGIVGNSMLELPTQQLTSTMKSPGMIYFMLIFGWIPALCLGVDVHNSFKKTALEHLHSAAELEFAETELPESLEEELYDFLEYQQVLARTAKTKKSRTHNTMRTESSE